MQESKFEDNDENEEEDDGGVELGKLRVATVQRHLRACGVAFRRKQPNVARQIVSLLRLGEEYLRARPFYYHAVTCLNAARALCHKHRVRACAFVVRVFVSCMSADRARSLQEVNESIGLLGEAMSWRIAADMKMAAKASDERIMTPFTLGKSDDYNNYLQRFGFSAVLHCIANLIRRVLRFCRHFHLAGKAGLANTACSERDELDDAGVEDGFPASVTDTIQALFDSEWE